MNRRDKRFIGAFGGAESHDKNQRTEGISWWQDEMPNENEYKIAYDNLRTHDNKVDFIITHSSPTSIQMQIKPQYNSNKLTEFLEEIKTIFRIKLGISDTIIRTLLWTQNISVNTMKSLK